MNYLPFWILSDNLRIHGEVKLKGQSVWLPLDDNTRSLLKCGVLSDVKPKVIYTKTHKAEDKIELVEPSSKSEEVKSKRRRKRNVRKSAERATDIRDTSSEVSEGLS